MTRYWAYIDDEVKGPYPPGKIPDLPNHKNLVYCREDEDDWIPFEDIPELEDEATSDSNQSEEPSLIQGTRRNVTVLFADLTGFTELTEEVGDEQIHRITNDVFDRLVPCVKEHGGEIDKYIGDEIMALYGAHETHEDDPERAVISALDMIEEVHGYNMDSDMGLSIHIGINTGKVVAADIGGDITSKFSVTGSGVDVAVGLTSEAEDESIYVGPATQKRLRGRFNLRPVPEVELKRLDKEIQAFEVVGRKTTEEAIDEEKHQEKETQTGGQSMSFVNREQEIKALKSVVEAADEENSSNPSAALISGPGGVGKTRLIAHFLAHETSETFENLTLQGDPYSERLPFSTSLPAFDRALGIGSHNKRPRTKQELAQFISRDSPFFEPLSLVYGAIEESKSSDDRFDQLEEINWESSDDEDDVENASEQIVSTLSKFLQKELSEKQIILTVDDAQWSDPRTILLLSDMIKKLPSSDVQLPIILDSRPSGIEDDPEKLKEIGDEATRTNMFVEEGISDSKTEGPPLKEILELDNEMVHLELSPLDQNIIQTIVENTFRGVNIPDGFVQSVEERTGGLAIHIEQVLRSLQDKGHIYRKGDQWVIDEQAKDVPMPETLHDLIVSRVDQLEESSRKALLVSSVLGVNFESWLIENVADQSSDELKNSINHLLNRGFLRTRENEYIFQHGTIQEVTYELLLDEDRKKFHSRAAVELRQRLNLDDPASRDRVAVHYREAEEWENLFKLRIQGIKQALKNYSLNDADRIAEEILEYEWESKLDSHWKGRFLYVIGRLRMYQFELEEARDYLKRSLEVSDESRDKRSMAMKHGTLGSIFEKMGEHEEAKQHQEKALELDREAQNNKGVGMRLGALGRIELKQNNFDDAFDLTNEALQIDRETNDKKGKAIRLSTLGQIEMKQGHFEEARDYFEKSLEVERNINNTRGQSITLGQLGKVNEELENYHEAKGYFKEALELDREMGNKYGMSFQLSALGRVAEKMDDLNEAEDFISQAQDVNDELGNKSARAYQLGILARISKKKKEYGRAQNFLDEAIELNRSLNDPHGQAIHHTTRAEVHEQSGNFGKALDDYWEALELNKELGNKPGQAIVYSSLGKLMESMGQWNSAEQYHEKSLELNRDMENPEGEAIGLAGLGRVAEERNDFEEAEQLSREALEINKGIDNKQGLALQKAKLARIAILDEKSNSEANEQIKESIDLAKSAGETPVHFTALRVKALIKTRSESVDEAIHTLKEAGSLYSRELDWLTPDVKDENIPDSLSGPALSIVITLARCNNLRGEHKLALDQIKRLLDVLPEPPGSPDQLKRFKEAHTLKARLTKEDFDEPWSLIKDRLGNIETPNQERKPSEDDSKTGWLDSTMDSVSGWLSEDSADSDESWEIIDPNFKTELKDSNKHGESLLVLVNLEEDSTKEVIHELSCSTSDPFSSDYDTRYQYGFFITSPNDQAVKELKELLSEYF